jgi:ABC-2 type transport system ATP-binding protein
LTTEKKKEMNTNKAIRVRDLHKKYDSVHAVRGVSFEVQTGEIFSLLGPNGAGKSTIISIIAGLLKPTDGDALVMGHSVTQDPMAVKAEIGVVPQEIALYEDLNARENLEFWAKMYGLRGGILSQRVDEVLEVIGLSERQKDRVDTYSGGMKRRLNIGVALLHRPAVVIMDEPTVGIDPQSRRNILDSVKAFNQEGMTVLYTTHYMEEAQELSDQIAIMDRGEVIAYGTHDELVKIVGELDRIDLVLQMSGGAPLEEADPSSAQFVEEWRTVDGVQQVSVESGTVVLLVDDSNLVLPLLFEHANRAGARITSVEIQEPNLEAVFLHLTGRALRD